jgi:hypothetical protein
MLRSLQLQNVPADKLLEVNAEVPPEQRFASRNGEERSEKFVVEPSFVDQEGTVDS